MTVRLISAAAAGTSGAPTVVQAGNLGASRTDAPAANAPIIVFGTLNANHVATVTPAAGAVVTYVLTQAAGNSGPGWTFTLSDGTNTQVLDVAPEAGATCTVVVRSDGTNLIPVVS